jgi:crotonobetainyl-CoA:carnitine CoA-transferase CaiB-like acyl-CoA transferase
MVSGDAPAPAPLDAPPYIPVNPTVGSFRTQDGRFITLMLLQPDKYFADLCKHLGLEHLPGDERLQSAAGFVTHADEIGHEIAAAFAAKPFAYWVEHLQTLEGPWAPAKNPTELVADPQLDANGCFFPWWMPTASTGGSWPTRCSSMKRRRA